MNSRIKLSKSKKAKILIGILIIVIVAFIAIKFLYPKFYAVTIPGYKGTVTEVQYHPNEAENGYFAFTVNDQTNNKKYRIEATGYMNTPLSPGSRGESCVDMPTHANLEGATIEFKLPEAKIDNSVDPGGTYNPYDKIFDICYNAVNDGAYYFKVVSFKDGSSKPDSYVKELLKSCKVKQVRTYDFNNTTYVQPKDGQEFEVSNDYSLEDEYRAAESKCGTKYLHDTNSR